MLGFRKKIYYIVFMEIKFKYYNRQITTTDIEFIKDLIQRNPGKSRWFISRELCRLWNWRQPNGALRDMVCRGLLKQLEDKGLIVQPPKKRDPNNPFINRKPPQLIDVDNRPLNSNLKTMVPIELKSVRKTKYERLYNSLIHEYHYLKYAQPVGENFKYIAFSNNRPIGCIGWTSPAWYIGCRDRFIGWQLDARNKNLHLIAYNTRFLILPWIKVPYLASHLLSLNAKTISSDWLNFYKHPIYFLETFVDTAKFNGTCYQAANWIYLGKTTGRGRLDQTHRQNRSLKDVYGYPLHKNFRGYLCH
jgi:hypothetical protein